LVYRNPLRAIHSYPLYLLSHPATAFSPAFRVCKTSGIVSARKLGADPRDAESPSRTGITRENACATQPDSPPCELLIRSPPVPRMVPRLSAINLLSRPNINFRSKGSMHRALIRDFH